MSKKIMGMAVILVFIIGVFVVSGIEGNTKASVVSGAYSSALNGEKSEQKVYLDKVTAGVSRFVFEESIVMEPEKWAEIQMNQNILVTTPLFGVDKDSKEEQSKEYNNRWGITLTDEEIDLLAKIVWLEARGESSRGQKAVVEVIFNRIKSKLFPNTLYRVLSQGNQFATWGDRENARPTDKEYESIRQVLMGNTKILKDKTVFFSRKPLTENVDKVIGGHSFCY